MTGVGHDVVTLGLITTIDPMTNQNHFEEKPVRAVRRQFFLFTQLQLRIDRNLCRNKTNWQDRPEHPGRSLTRSSSYT